MELMPWRDARFMERRYAGIIQNFGSFLIAGKEVRLRGFTQEGENHEMKHVFEAANAHSFMHVPSFMAEFGIKMCLAEVSNNKKSSSPKWVGIRSQPP
ncbi:MAG: hypothetical protein JEZ02_00640 [Desulfatibacillum sp.]|nr:hypothetical protein [Desulfatibacillum sp.]